MKRSLLAFFGGYHEDMPNQSEENVAYLQLVRTAKEEWQTAQNYFENVSDPELVDFAIYKLEATRRRYMYLLKQARIQGLEEKHVLQQKNEANLS